MTGSRRDFSKLNRQNQMSKYGHEPVDGGWLAPPALKRRPSKAELREQIAAACSGEITVNKHLACKCGHKTKVRVQLTDSPGPFHCSVCGERL